MSILLAKFWGPITGIITGFMLILMSVFAHWIEGKRWLIILFEGCFMGIIAAIIFWRMGQPILIEKTQIWKLEYDVELIKIDAKPDRKKVYGYGIIKNIFHKKYTALNGQKIYFYLNGNGHYIPSQIVRMRSKIRILNPDNTEPFFNYLPQKNIFLYAYRGEIFEIIKDATLIHQFFAAINLRLHDRIATYGQKHGHHDADGILYGLLLSEKKELSKQQKDHFHYTGAAHLLAVSGLHIGIMGFALDFLLHCFFLGKIWRRIPILGILLLYIGIIGFPPSAARAWLMLACHWLSHLFHRDCSGIVSLLNATVISLIYNPILLFDIGFQLSYGVVAMLLLLSMPIRDGLLWCLNHRKSNEVPKKKNPSPLRIYVIQKSVGLLAVSMAATLASAPLTFEYFNMFSLTGIILNPIVIEMALPSVVCGFLFLIIGLLHVDGLLGDGLFWCARWGVSWIDHILSWSEYLIPWHVEYSTKPKGLGILFFVVCLLLAVGIYGLRLHFQRKRI